MTPPSGRRRSHIPMRAMLPAAALLLAALGPASHAQKADEPRQGTLIQREEVRFVTLDLVVEDKRGGAWRRTTDLRQEQIRLQVGGKDVALDSFDSVCPVPGTVTAQSAGAPPASPKPAPADDGAADEEFAADDETAAPAQDPGGESAAGAATPDPHRYILYFDVESLTLAARRNSFKAALEWAEKSAQPTDHVMIITGGQSLRIPRPFLPASEHLREDLQAAMEDFSSVDTWADGERERLDELARTRNPRDREVLAGAYATIDYDNARRAIDNVRNVMAIFASTPGTKNLLFFTETLRLVPGEIYMPPVRPRSASTLNQPIQRELPDVHPPLQQLAQEANDRNVRIYTVQAGGLERDVEDPMTFLATETGGAHVQWTNRLAEIFDRTGQDLSCYYRIGFRLPARRSGQTERILVRIAGDESQYRLRYRRTLDDPTQEQRDEASLRAAFLQPSAATAFPIGLEVTRLKREARGARFRIQILVPLDGLLTLPGPDTAHREVRLELGGQVVPLLQTAGISGMTQDADLWADVWVSRKSWGFGRSATLRMPPAVATGTMRGRKAALYTHEFLAPPGRYRIVAVVNDLNSHTVSASVTDFESAPPLAALAGAMLGFEGKDLVPLPAEATPVEEGKAKRWNGKELEPAIPEVAPAILLASRPGIGTERELWALYEVCRPAAANGAAPKHSKSGGDSPGWKLDRILDCMGKSVELPVRAFTPPAGDTPCVLVTEEIPTSGLPQGSCRLSVVLRHNAEVEPPRDLEFTILPSTPAAAPANSP